MTLMQQQNIFFELKITSVIKIFDEGAKVLDEMLD